jgi:hypothetical protein
MSFAIRRDRSHPLAASVVAGLLALALAISLVVGMLGLLWLVSVDHVVLPARTWYALIAIALVALLVLDAALRPQAGPVHPRGVIRRPVGCVAPGTDTDGPDAAMAVRSAA